MSADVETLQRALRACESEQECLRVALRSLQKDAARGEELWRHFVELDRVLHGVSMQSHDLPERVVNEVRDLVLERNLLRVVTLGTE
jgi:hypothetical protein